MFRLCENVKRLKRFFGSRSLGIEVSSNGGPLKGLGEICGKPARDRFQLCDQRAVRMSVHTQRAVGFFLLRPGFALGQPARDAAIVSKSVQRLTLPQRVQD